MRQAGSWSSRLYVRGPDYGRFMDPGDWTAAEWGAFGQVGALVVAAVAGVLVWLQVRQGRQVRDDQTRPYVIVDFEFRGTLVAIAVENIGTTPAREVRFRFAPPLQRPTRDGLDEVAIFVEGVPMIAPARRILIPYGDGPSLFSEDSNARLRYEVHLEYTDLGGKKRYIDPPLILDLAPYKHSLVGRDDLHQIYQNLKGVKELMKSWTSDRRLKVNTLSQSEVDEHHRQWYEQRQAEQWEAVKREHSTESNAVDTSTDDT